MRNVCLRMEFWYQDGTKIGSMLSNSVDTIREGSCRFRLEIDLAGFMAGKYSADIVAYTVGLNGMQELLDGVYPGIIFEVENTPEADRYVEWNHQY